MKSLYDSNFRYTKEAGNLDASVSILISPIFKSYLISGYSPREICHIMNSAISMLELEGLLIGDIVVEPKKKKGKK